MYSKLHAVVLVFYWNGILSDRLDRRSTSDDDNKIELVDLTRPTNWNDLYEYYDAMEKRWKICVNCGAPGLGTAMHLEHTPTVGSMRPAVIPSEYLLTRMAIVDVSSHTVNKPDFVLSLEVGQQWLVLKHDPQEPTLLLFKFGWPGDRVTARSRSCVCVTPGISYELAEWIATNLTHVMGVATDAPTLESDQTREFASRTVSNLLGKNGVYMIENVYIRKKIPEQGCMAYAMPLKLLNFNFVPTRLTAFCPTTKTDKEVVVALRNHQQASRRAAQSRLYDVDMEDVMLFDRLN